MQATCKQPSMLRIKNYEKYVKIADPFNFEFCKRRKDEKKKMR